MPTTSTKGKPVLAGTDAFAPYTHINNAVNWAETFASVRNVADSTAMNALSGNDVWVGLTVYHTSGTYAGNYWVCTATSGSPATGTWKLLNIGTVPRLELTRITTGTNFFTSSSTANITGYTQTENRGGFTEASGVVTVPVAGRYNIFGQFAYSASATGYRSYTLVCSGSQTQSFRNIWQAQSGSGLGTIAANGIKLAAGDTIVMQGLQNSGAALDLQYTTGFPTKLVIEYVGP